MNVRTFTAVHLPTIHTPGGGSYPPPGRNFQLAARWLVESNKDMPISPPQKVRSSDGLKFSILHSNMSVNGRLEFWWNRGPKNYFQIFIFINILFYLFIYSNLIQCLMSFDRAWIALQNELSRSLVCLNLSSRGEFENLHNLPQ